MCEMRSNQSHRRSGLLLGNWVKALIVFAFLAVSGCTGILTASDDDPLADHSFLTGEPCEAPCWYGLELDKASEDDIIGTLHGLPFIEASTIYTYTSNWINDNSAVGINYGCSHPPMGDFCGSFLLSDNKLKYIRLTVGYKLTLETVVSKLGSPDYIDYGPIHVDVGGCDLNLYWPEQNIQAEFINREADALCQAIQSGEKISPRTVVTALWYSVSEGFGPLPGGCCRRIPWPGFSE